MLTARTLGAQFIISCLLFFMASVNTSEGAVYIKWNCQPNSTQLQCARAGGIEYIYLYDRIDTDTASMIAYVDGLLPPKAKFPIVYLNSFGGYLEEAVAIGRTLRRRDATVESLDVFFPAKKPECSSACVLVAAGATTRNLISIGLHNVRVEKRIAGIRYETVSEPSKNSNDEIELYYMEMGISPEIYNISRNTHYDDLSVISFDPELPFVDNQIVRLGFLHNELTDELKALVVRNAAWSQERILGMSEAAARGDADAVYRFGNQIIYGVERETNNQHVGMKYLMLAAEMGHLNAMHSLGVVLMHGFGDIEKDEQAAVLYYKRAAESGFPASMNNLAWAYYKGTGAPKHIGDAIYWATRSAEQGEPFAYSTLGTIRFETSSFEHNNIETYFWLTLAFDKLPIGDAKGLAWKKREAVRMRMTLKEINIAEERARNWSPLRQSMRTMADPKDR